MLNVGPLAAVCSAEAALISQEAVSMFSPPISGVGRLS